MSETKLHELFAEQGQSPWLDNLRRSWIHDGELQAWLDKGVRGITSNPSIFQKAIEGSDDYTEQFSELLAAGKSVEESYWGLVIQDIEDALALTRPLYDASDRLDGYVSVEVDPGLARDREGTEAAARELWGTIDEPNLYVKIPATAEGVPAIRQMIAEKRSINVTLLFSVERYRAVMEAYIAGLEAAEGDLSAISSVASFFISRVDVEVDKRLTAIGTDAALALRGQAAIANGKLAYQAYTETFSGPRWDALVERGGPTAATAVGIDGHQGSFVPRHPLHRHAYRPRHGEHDPGLDARRLPGPRVGRSHARCRRRRCAVGSRRHRRARHRPRRRRDSARRRGPSRHSRRASTASSRASRRRRAHSRRAERSAWQAGVDLDLQTQSLVICNRLT